MEAVLATIETAQALRGPLCSGYTWEWPADHLFPSRRIFSSCFKFLRVSLETSANEMYQGLRLVSELPGSLQKVLRGREEGALVWELPTGEGVLPQEGRLTDVLFAWSFTASKALSETPYPGFPGGSVVKNLPASAGDTGLIPGPGRSHVPRSNQARVCHTTEAAALEPVLCNKRRRRVENQRVAPRLLQLGENPQSNKDTIQPKINP